MGQREEKGEFGDAGQSLDLRYLAYLLVSFHFLQISDQKGESNLHHPIVFKMQVTFLVTSHSSGSLSVSGSEKWVN